MKRSKRKQLNRQKKPLQINVDPATLPIIECECGNDVFIQGIRVRKLSAIISPDGQVKYIHEPVMICGQCSKLLPATP